MKNQFVLKICIAGSDWDLNIQIIQSVTDRAFDNITSRITGADIRSKIIKYQGEEIKFILHIVRGEGVFRRLRLLHYEGSVGCVIIFDKGVRASFETVDRYYQEYRQVQGLEKPVALLGVISDNDEISFDEATAQAKLLDLTYFECKPTDIKVVMKIFDFLARKALGKCVP